MPLTPVTNDLPQKLELLEAFGLDLASSACVSL